MDYSCNITYNITYHNNDNIFDDSYTSTESECSVTVGNDYYPHNTNGQGLVSIDDVIQWDELVTVTGDYCNLGSLNGGSSQTITVYSDPTCDYGSIFGECEDSQIVNVDVFFNPPIGCMNELSCNYDSGAVYDDGSCTGAPNGEGLNQTYCNGSSLELCVETGCNCAQYGACGDDGLYPSYFDLDCTADEKPKYYVCNENASDCDINGFDCENCTEPLEECNDAIGVTLTESNNSSSVITGQMLSFSGVAQDDDVTGDFQPQYWRMFISDTPDASGINYSINPLTNNFGSDWNDESSQQLLIVSNEEIYFTENLQSDGTPLVAGEYYVIFDVADNVGNFNSSGNDARTNYGPINVLGDNPGCRPDLAGGLSTDSPSGDEQAINYNYRFDGGDITYHSPKHCLSLDSLVAFANNDINKFLSNGYYDGNDIEIPIDSLYQPITGDVIKIRIDLDDDWVYDEFEDWSQNNDAHVAIDYNYIDGNNLYNTENIYLQRGAGQNDIYNFNLHSRDSEGQVYYLAGDYTIRVYFIVPDGNILYHKDFSFTIEETPPEDLQIVNQFNELYENFSIYFDVDAMPFTYTFNGSYVDPTTPIGDLLRFNWTIITPTETQTSTSQNFGDFTFDEIGTYTISFSVTDPLGTVSTSITVNVYDEFFNKLGNFLTGTEETDVEINESFTDLDAWLISDFEFGNYLGDTLAQYCTDVASDNVAFLEAELAKIVLGDDGYTQNQYDIVDDDNSDPDYAIFQYDATKSYVVPDADNAGAITEYLEQEVSTNELPNPATGNETYIIFEYQTGVDADGDGNANPYQYVDLYVENVNYFEAKLIDLGNPATPQIYNLGSLNLPMPSMDLNPDYHVFQYDSEFANYTTLAAIYSQGKADGDAESGTADDISYLENELARIAGLENNTYTNIDNVTETPDYHIFNWLSGYEYTTNDIEVAEWLGTVAFGSKQTYNISGFDLNFVVFAYDDDLDVDGNYAELTSLDAIYEAGISAGQTDTFQGLDNVEYLDAQLSFILLGTNGYNQNEYKIGGPADQTGTPNYHIFAYDSDYDGLTSLDAIYEAGVTDGQNDTFQDLDNVEFLETELANIVDGSGGYTQNQYDVGNDGNVDYAIFEYDVNKQYVVPDADNQDAIDLFLHNNFSHEFIVENDNDLPGVDAGTYKYAIFEYDDNLDTNGLYAGATTLNEIYLAGQTDTFQDLDNNQAIEDFIKEALEAQSGNTITITPGSDPINVAIFEYNPNDNVSYNASDTEADYADETAAFDAGVAQGISQSQIQYPDIYIKGNYVELEQNFDFLSYPFEDSYWTNGGNSILDNLKQQHENNTINLTNGDALIVLHANESGDIINSTAIWNFTGNNEWFTFTDFSQVLRGASLWLAYSGEATTLNWSNGLQQAGGPTE